MSLAVLIALVAALAALLRLEAEQAAQLPGTDDYRATVTRTGRFVVRRWTWRVWAPPADRTVAGCRWQAAGLAHTRIGARVAAATAARAHLRHRTLTHHHVDRGAAA